MENVAYRDLDGNIVPRHLTSRHHLFARSLAGNSNKRFINQTPLVPRMLNEYHQFGSDKALHTNVELLRVPPLFVVNCLQSAINELESMNYYDRLIEFTQRVEEMSQEDTAITKDCIKIADNLQRQLPFILLGQVEVVCL